MTAEYNKVHNSDLTINLNSVSPGTGAPLYEAKIRSLISAGNPPDFFTNYIHSLAAPYIKQGLDSTDHSLVREVRLGQGAPL